MKKLTFLTCVLLSISSLVSAQSADDIIGKWKDGYESRQIQIFKRGDRYFGKLIWLKEPNDEYGKPRLDVNNPDKNQQKRAVIGLEILKDFTYKPRGVYTKGKIYDIKSGNTYNGMMNIHNRNKLNIRAYLGLTIIGKTEAWTRVE